MALATEAVQKIRIDYSPREPQKAIHAALKANRFAVIVAHRRMGKTVSAVNHLIRAAMQCQKPRPRFAYIGPTFRMAKQTAFDYLTHFSRPIPGVSVNVSELRVDYPNGGQVRLYGADNPDSLRGLYLDGVVLDEYGLMQSNVFSEVLRPALADREGWALFIGTPNGRNQFSEIAAYAKQTEGWFFAEFKASQTGIMSAVELEAARSVMTPDEYQQEFECSFEAAVRGAIYATELQRAREDGRITRVPIEPLLPVDTAWDLGVGDATAIWFTQSLRSGEVRVVDYYESSGEGLPHYIAVLKAKGYVYGVHTAPHDIQVKEFASGRSRLEAAASLGIRFTVAPNVGIEEGIHAARMLFPKCYFDGEKCKAGLEGLQHYRRDFNQRLNEFKATPVHDFASHPADAWRYFAVSQKAPKAPVKAQPSVRLPSLGPGGWMAS